MNLALLGRADQLLRGTGEFDATLAHRRPAWLLPLIVLTFAPIYGGFMGSFALDAPERLLQVLYSAVKLPLLLFATSAVCLPAFFVINTILGLREDWRESLQAILAGQAVLSVVLAALSPLTRFFYFCDASYRGALLFNTAALAVSTAAAQIVMLRYYRVLIRRNQNHRIALGGWLVLYSFVGIQMGWVLRPFVGSPNMAVTFFRKEAFTNAYVVVAELIFGT
jgi:hypothetical protein